MTDRGGVGVVCRCRRQHNASKCRRIKSAVRDHEPRSLQALRLKVLDIRLVPSAALSPHDRPAGHVCLFREISLSKQTSRTQARHGQAVFISC